MSRQSITFTEPNDKWMSMLINSKEYSSKSEIINDLIRRARQYDILRSQLIEGENSGFTTESRDEILSQIKSDLDIT